MAHVRKSIRDAHVVAVTGLTTTGARVYPGRVYPLQAAELPALLVYTDAEDVQTDQLGVNRTLEREVDIVIEACFKDTVSLDDKGDVILTEVETALGTPGVNLGGAKRTQLSRIEFERDAQGEKPAARMKMVFKALYYTARGAPTIAQ